MDIKPIQNKSLSTCHNFILLDYNINCLIAALFIDIFIDIHAEKRFIKRHGIMG